jgi:hypothetical protein
LIRIKRVKDTFPNWLLINGSSISLKCGERCLTPLSTIFQVYSGGSVLLVDDTGVPKKNH